MKESRPGITEKLRRIKEYSFRTAPQTLVTFGALTFAGSATGAVIKGSEIFANNGLKPDNSSITREIPYPKQIIFPFENKNQLTIEEFNQQFDAVFNEARKAMPESIIATAIFYSPQGEQIFLSKRQAERIILPLPQDPNNSQIPNTFREILVNSLDMHQYPTLQKFPSYSAKSQTWYVLPEGHKPRLQNSVVIENTPGANKLEKSKVREITPDELYHLAKSLTETFNWSVDNGGFYPLKESPKISPPSLPQPEPYDPFVPRRSQEDDKRA